MKKLRKKVKQLTRRVNNLEKNTLHSFEDAGSDFTRFEGELDVLKEDMRELITGQSVLAHDYNTRHEGNAAFARACALQSGQANPLTITIDREAYQELMGGNTIVSDGFQIKYVGEQA